MNDLVSADLRRFYREQEVAAQQDLDSLEWHKEQAEAALLDPEKLKRVLNDTELAHPLSICFGAMDKALVEMQGMNTPHVALILATVERMRKQAFDWLMEDA